MTWSFTGSKVFDKCQIQWFYRNLVAEPRAKKDPLRREAYVLSCLQTISAWRGHLVDHVISSQIVPMLEKGKEPTISDVLIFAKLIFERQRSFAFQQRVRDPEFVKSKAGDSYAAFAALEYGQSVSEEELKVAWEDIEQALRNFLGMRELLDRLKQAERLIAQRVLNFSVFDAKAQARPDLIAFYRNQPPLIIDWKVHSFGTTDYRLQLATYALALERCPPHKDFPTSNRGWEATEIELIEAQLLTNKLRSYSLTERDIEELESRIIESSTGIRLTIGSSDWKTLNISELAPTENPETCEKCVFRKLCWKEKECVELRQMTLL